MQVKIKDTNFWDKEINDYKLSGQSARAFSQSRGYPYTTFMGRLYRKPPTSKVNKNNQIKNSKIKSIKNSLVFSEIHVSKESKSMISNNTTMFIVFPNGLKMEFSHTPSPCWLAELGGLFNERN